MRCVRTWSKSICVRFQAVPQRHGYFQKCLGHIFQRSLICQSLAIMERLANITYQNLSWTFHLWPNYRSASLSILCFPITTQRVKITKKVSFTVKHFSLRWKKIGIFHFWWWKGTKFTFKTLCLNFLVLQLSLGSKENWVNEKMVKVDAKSSDETHLVRHKSCSLVIKLHYSGMLYLSQKLAELLCNINQTVEYTNHRFFFAACKIRMYKLPISKFTFRKWWRIFKSGYCNFVIRFLPVPPHCVSRIISSSLESH